MQCPPLHMSKSREHSLMSSHFSVTTFFVYPSLHSHVYEPGLLTQFPPSQIPGMASHSFTSWHPREWMLVMYPRSHSSLAGQAWQGWPQARPMVAQHSCRVHTTPGSWSEHDECRILRKHGPVR